MKRLVQIIVFAVLLGSCVSSKETDGEKTLLTPKARNVKPGQIQGYHEPLDIKIAWMPYKDLGLKQGKDNNWVIVKSESGREGAIPVILITYPETKDSVWIEMDTSNELLGKLVKHSLMTKQPIHRPFKDYFEKASCSTCHPADVKVDFDAIPR